MSAPKNHMNRILDVVEAFLDTHPDYNEHTELDFGNRATGEDQSSYAMQVRVDGGLYVVIAKKVGA